MKTKFTAEWKLWIKTNVDNGQNKDGLFKILLDKGYKFSAIEKEMNFRPTVPVSELVNPFDAQKNNAKNSPKKQKPTSNHGAALNPNKLVIPNAKKYDSKKLA